MIGKYIKYWRNELDREKETKWTIKRTFKIMKCLELIRGDINLKY